MTEELTSTTAPEEHPEDLSKGLGAVATKATQHELPELESASESVELEVAYQSQVEILTRVGILRELATGEMGIVGVDGKEYSVPTLEKVQALLDSQKEKLDPEIAEGYNQLLLVPFGAASKDLLEVYKQKLLERIRQEKLKDSESQDIKLTSLNDYQRQQYPNPDEMEQKFIDESIGRVSTVLTDSYTNPRQFPIIESPDLLYQYYSPKKGEAGLTKLDRLQETSPTPGWQVVLMKDEPEAKTKYKAAKMMGFMKYNRALTPLEYLQEIKGNQKDGLSPETWLTYALVELESKDLVIDVHNSCYLLGVHAGRKGYLRSPTTPLVGWLPVGTHNNDGKKGVGLAIGAVRDAEYSSAYRAGARFCVRVS